jgi:hypothetical protein
MELSAGRSDVAVGLVDGPVAVRHPDLAGDIREAPGSAAAYPAIYARAAQSYAENASLSAVDVQSSPLSGTRKIVDVIFSHTNRNTDYTEKHFVRVDITDDSPYLVTKLSPYYDR